MSRPETKDQGPETRELTARLNRMVASLARLENPPFDLVNEISRFLGYCETRFVLPADAVASLELVQTSPRTYRVRARFSNAPRRAPAARGKAAAPSRRTVFPAAPTVRAIAPLRKLPRSSRRA